MLTIRRPSLFRRDYKRMMRRGCNGAHFQAVLDVLANGKSLAPKHRDHALAGNWKGFRECHIEPDWLLIYCKTDAALYLIRTGTHSDLFGR